MTASAHTVHHHKKPHQSRANVSQRATLPINAPGLIAALRSQAATLLQASLGTSPLQSFQVGALGNFPYYWQNPSNLDFNHLTYGWIDSNLAANTTPFAQDGVFTNEYIQALAAVTYSLSTADQAKLVAAQQAATNQQLAMLKAWQAAFGSIPQAANGLQPIDIIMNTIKTTWAQPATTLPAMQRSNSLTDLLSNMPASGEPIIPVLVAYLDAIGGAVSLADAEGSNRQALHQALTNARTPVAGASGNGGLSTDDGLTQPAYAVSTALNGPNSIISGLQDTSNSVTVNMTVERTSASEYQVSIAGQASFTIPVDDFISVNVNASANYFKDTIATSSNKVQVAMTFTGVTLVNFGPAQYSLSSGQNWFWMDPIRQAIANGTNDVTGFKFSPNPGIDFSASGPFGYMTGVAIANYPSVQITVTSSDFESMHKTFSSHVDVDVDFLWFSVGSGSASTYSSDSSSDSSTQTVTITLNPPQALVAGQLTDSVGFILGVQTDFPAATN